MRTQTTLFFSLATFSLSAFSVAQAESGLASYDGYGKAGKGGELTCAHRTRQFDTVPCEGTAGRNIVWPRGRVIGGSSSINGLIFIRGQHEDFDDWASQGASGYWKTC